MSTMVCPTDWKNRAVSGACAAAAISSRPVICVAVHSAAAEAPECSAKTPASVSQKQPVKTRAKLCISDDSTAGGPDSGSVEGSDHWNVLRAWRGALAGCRDPFARRTPADRSSAVVSTTFRLFTLATTRLRVAVSASAVSSAMQSRSEEHTSELQSHVNLVCRLLL